MEDAELPVEYVNTIYGNFFSWQGDLITQQLKTYSAHTRNELAMIKTFISSGDNIIDVGAHIGTFSIPFSKFNEAKGTIYSFEANPNNYKLLGANIVENNVDSTVIPHLSIVSDEESTFKMMLPYGGNSGMYTFLPDENSQRPNKFCINLDVWHEENHKEVPIHFIKIDVEGAEVSVLRSGHRLIEKYLPILYVELNETALGRFGKGIDDVDQLLRSYGYHFFRNIGLRNSDNDLFEIQKLENLKEGGIFFDVLAIHSSSQKYPKQFS